MSRFAGKLAHFDRITECAEWPPVIYVTLAPLFPTYNCCETSVTLDSNRRICVYDYTDGATNGLQDIIRDRILCNATAP